MSLRAPTDLYDDPCPIKCPIPMFKEEEWDINLYVINKLGV